MSQHYSMRLRDEIDRLGRQTASGDVFTRDCRMITEFVDKRLTADDAADSTKFQYCSRLRTLSKRAEKPIPEYDQQEMQDLMDSMATGDHPDVKDDGVKVANWITALCKLRHSVALGFDPDNIEASDDLGRDLSADDLLTQQEVDALLDACGPDLRYKALIAWGLATGQRLDAIRTVKLRHVSFDGQVGEIRLNEAEGALKGHGGSVPLLWAKPYVRDWLEIHPDPDNPDAALFCGDPRLGEHYNARTGNFDMTDPLHPRSIRGRLHDLAERAGIEPGKNVYPHLFRHSAITRMILNDVPRQQIISLVGWSGDTTQFETYQTLADELRNDALRRNMGLPTSATEQAVIGQPTLDRCPKCNDKIRESDDRCTTCLTPLTHDADPEPDPSTEEEIERKMRDLISTIEASNAVDLDPDTLLEDAFDD